MKVHIKASIWEKIFRILSKIKGVHIKNERKVRRFVEAVWFMARSGCQWRLLPKCYGNLCSVHARFMSWMRAGVWQHLFEFSGKDADLEAILIDTTIVRAHACSAGYGKEVKEKMRLAAAKVDLPPKSMPSWMPLGNPLKFILTAGQRHDISQAEHLTEDLHDTTLIADKGYDSNAFVQSLEKKGCRVVIPSRKNRKMPRTYDKHVYKERHLIECFFSKIKHFRRIFSRFDKASNTFLRFLHFVGALICLR